ncbi:hypothetical protein D3C73_1595150 [compost metagenome]
MLGLPFYDLSGTDAAVATTTIEHRVDSGSLHGFHDGLPCDNVDSHPGLPELHYKRAVATYRQASGK